MTAQINKIKEDLELAHSGARMLGNEEDVLRISRALAALMADTDMDIFSEEFERKIIENECTTV